MNKGLNKQNLSNILIQYKSNKISPTNIVKALYVIRLTSNSI